MTEIVRLGPKPDDFVSFIRLYTVWPLDWWQYQVF